MTNQDVIDLILKELERAESIHPVWPSDPVHAQSNLTEEAGEALRATKDMYNGQGNNTRRCDGC